jgi:hypothetical protein
MTIFRWEESRYLLGMNFEQDNVEVVPAYSV